MSRPFVVFSLPRSRSAWLSVFLGSPDQPVGHDIGVTSATPQAFIWRLQNELRGTCETGAAFAWRLIRAELPDAVFMVVRRDPGVVAHSLERLGLGDHRGEMQARASHLDELSAQPGTLTLQFADLAQEWACAAAYRHCLGRDMPAAWWRHLDPINVQVDMARQVHLLTKRRSAIDAIKSAAREQMADA